jgi:hypothetical protein
MVGVEDEEERPALGGHERHRALHHRFGGAVAQQEIDARVAADLVGRPSMSIDTTGPLAPRAASVSAKKSAEPPWREPVSITCSMRRSKMISW